MANSSNLMPIELLNARRTREERSENAKKAGLHLFGFADASGQTVQVVKEEKKR